MDREQLIAARNIKIEASKTQKTLKLATNIAIAHLAVPRSKRTDFDPSPEEPKEVIENVEVIKSDI